MLAGTAGLCSARSARERGGVTLQSERWGMWEVGGEG